jgi:hypothetical protein
MVVSGPALTVTPQALACAWLRLGDTTTTHIAMNTRNLPKNFLMLFVILKMSAVFNVGAGLYRIKR